MTLLVLLCCFFIGCMEDKRPPDKDKESSVLVHLSHDYIHSKPSEVEHGMHWDFFDYLKKERGFNYKIISFEDKKALTDKFFSGKGSLLGQGLIQIEKNKDQKLLFHVHSGPHQLKIQCLKITKKNKSFDHFSCNPIGRPTNKRFVYLIKAPLSDREIIYWPIDITEEELYKKLKKELKTYKAILKLSHLNEKYFGHLGLFNKFDIYVLKKRYKSVFPKYKNLFKEAAMKNGFDPLFLAAMSYQESHWNEEAVSFTGVKGLMMLTRATAKSLGVADRTDPKQSIEGGARYFTQMIKRVPASVENPDREWFALAAYNVGLGHVYDARLLATEENLDEDLWLSLKQTLPYLSEPEYYKRTKYGRARGHEPVRYVQSIRSFYWHLQKLEKN